MIDGRKEDEESLVDTVILFEEYRLIEKDESQVSLKWKGAHLVLFALAFIFGVMSTFFLHVLAFMFDKQCVLNPQLLSLDATKHVFIYEFLPKEIMDGDLPPMDFLSIQWADESECTLPFFVPICSAVFGLIWTTMFLMCSSGNRAHSLQRPWRLMLPVLLFSLTMGGLCVHASLATHDGLQQLCLTIGKFTGSEDCSYIMNVATLPYEGRIRGVYQAVRLTIFSAWIHTICWLLVAALVILRVVLVVDFQMVRIRAEMKGDIETLLGRYERQLHSETLESGITYDTARHRWIALKLPQSTQTNQYNAGKDTGSTSDETETDTVIFSSSQPKMLAVAAVDSDKATKGHDLLLYFKIRRILCDLVDSIPLRQSSIEMNQQSLESPSTSHLVSKDRADKKSSKFLKEKHLRSTNLDPLEGTSRVLAPEIQNMLKQNLNEALNRSDSERHVSFTIKRKRLKQEEGKNIEQDSSSVSTTSLVQQGNAKIQKRNVSVQTDDSKKDPNESLTQSLISGDEESDNTSSESLISIRKDVQKPKQKRD